MAGLRIHEPRVLEASLNGDSIKALAGSMVAYEGRVEFKKASFGGGEGVARAFKRKLTGEGLDLMECIGSGKVYLADNAQEIFLVDLDGSQNLSAEASSLLAMSGNLNTNVVFTGLQGAASGGQGLFSTVVAGTGQVALVSDGPAICLEVSPNFPLVVDPQAYVASQGQLSQGFVTDVSYRSVIGQGSGEEFSIRFTGSGRVWIQPAER